KGKILLNFKNNFNKCTLKITIKMRTYFILFTLLITKVITAQNITGVVTDENQYPLEDVYVYNNNSAAHAHTKANGTFILEKTKAGVSLEVGILGLKKKVIILTKAQVNRGENIKWKRKTLQLDEIVKSRK